MSAKDYGREAFAAAANHIATSTESLRVRLKEAIVRNLMELHPENLPDGMWRDFSAILDRLSRSKPRDDEGTVEASLRHMTDNELEEIAKKLSSLCQRVASSPA
jgi:hypothetical protein